VHVCDQEEVFGAGTWAEKCEILAEACQEKFEFMNFMHFFMCDIEGNMFIFSLVAFFIVLTVFRFMCDVVDEYIAEALVYFTKFLNLSEALAGVTLLALANGAGDLLTILFLRILRKECPIIVGHC